MYHTAYILHTYCIYICYLAAQHTYCIHAHLHTQYMYIHIACMLHTQKMAQRHTHAIQAYELMYAVCVQLFTCSMYAAHKLHTSCIHVFRYVRPHVHVCGMRVALSQFLCMQHTCKMGVLCVQHACSIYAQLLQQGSRLCATHKQHFYKGIIC